MLKKRKCFTSVAQSYEGKKCRLTVINVCLVVGEDDEDNLKDNVRRIDDCTDADDCNEVVAIASCTKRIKVF